MGKVELKTQKNSKSVDDFLASIEDEAQKEDCIKVRQLMSKASGDPGSMWGASIVGFGSYHYRYQSGREADWMKIGFSPRKGKTTLYIMDGFDGYAELLRKLGPHKLGKSCLYIKHLKDVDLAVLEKIITKSYQEGVPIGEVA